MSVVNTDGRNGIHIFVFCCADYVDMLDDCIRSVEEHVADCIISRNIVSNTRNINVNGYNLIHDIDFWKKLDPDFTERELYNHNWIKQQIFKLNIDKFVDGYALIVDAEVRFTHSVKWIENNAQKIFYSNYWTDYWFSSHEFIKQIANLESDMRKTFIVEAMIFSTDILKKLRRRIEDTNGLSQIESFKNIIFDIPMTTKSLPKSNMQMSEYDLYATYILKFYPEKVLLQSTPKPFYSVQHSLTSNSKKSQTKWLTFFEQVRGENWPDCDSEVNFSNLPDWIQKECIEVHGYKPN